MPVVRLSLLTVLLLALRTPAFAGIVYSNGVPNGTSGAYAIDINAVTDSFTDTSNSTITQIVFASG